MANSFARRRYWYALAAFTMFFAHIGDSSATHIMYLGGQPLAGGTAGAFIFDVTPGTTGPGEPPIVQMVWRVVNIYLNVPYEPGPETSIATYTEFGPLEEGDYEVNIYAAIYAADTSRPDYSLRGSFPLTVVSSSNLRRTYEYYYAAKNHYFITGDPDEILALDTGRFPGWTRTGQQFWSFVPLQPIPSTLAPVCRFYGLPSAGLDSHFFSSSVAECQYVQDHWPYAWQLEAQNVFEVVPLDSFTGHCPPSTSPVYRLYNNQPDVNHRYTYFPQTIDLMVAQGWINEGQVWCSSTATGT